LSPPIAIKKTLVDPSGKTAELDSYAGIRHRIESPGEILDRRPFVRGAVTATISLRMGVQERQGHASELHRRKPS
jgi:hypothetical protein